MNLGSALGVASFGGPQLLGGALGFADTIAQGAFSAQQANRQMAFQQNMRDTAFQARAADLAAAGLNPVLAATGGPAAVPAGAMATTPPMSTIGNIGAAASAFKTYQEGRQAKVVADVYDDLKGAGQPGVDALKKFLSSPTDWLDEVVAPVVNSAKDLPGKVSESVDDAIRNLRYALSRDPPGTGRVPPFSAVEVSRSSGSDVVPGGAYTGNRPRMGGQLGRLRSKSLQGFVGE